MSDREPLGLRRRGADARIARRLHTDVLRLPRAALAAVSVRLVGALRTPAVGLAYAAAATVLAVGVLAGVDVTLERLTGSNRNAVAAALIGVLFLQTFGGIGVSRFWERWLPWRRATVEDAGILVGAALASVALLTVLFAAATALVDANGWLTSRPPTDEDFAWRALEHYAWHFFDAIPALEIPATLDWSLGTTYLDVRAGGLLLAYKVLAIVPIVRLIVDLVDARRGAAGSEASGPAR